MLLKSSPSLVNLLLAIACSLLFGPISLAASQALIEHTDYDPAVPTLEQVVGHAPGTRISSHADSMAYLQALVHAAPQRIQLHRYAATWEGRTLVYAIIGSRENMQRLEKIQGNIQALARPRNLSGSALKATLEKTPATVWLAYSVHGDEISSTDAGLYLAYHLLASRNDPVVEEILNNTLVFIDPMQNPDGRERFISGSRAAQGLQPDSDRITAEHEQPWPGGRTNHYLFDMNRDWLTLTQPETRGRVAALLKWYPLVFVDAHEMQADASYFFSPEAIPFNPHLQTAQTENLSLFGRNNARWFDRIGADYYTREIFDAFYPGYGASWPSYYGGIAMTYEQASSRGLRMRRSDGSEFSYLDAVKLHFITSLATAQTGARQRTKLWRDFVDYRRQAVAQGRKSLQRTRILPRTARPVMADQLAAILAAQEIAVTRADRPFKACGKSYPAGGYVIDSAQAAFHRINVLLDPQVDMSAEFLKEQERRRGKGLDNEIYDTTAWSLPLMYGVRMDSCKRAVDVAGVPVTAYAKIPGVLHEQKSPVAYLVTWNTAGARFLSEALQHDLKVLSSDRPFAMDGRQYPSGSLIIKAQARTKNLPRLLLQIAKQSGADVFAVSDSWVTQGPNFGSEHVHRVPRIKIAMAWDVPSSPTSAGNTRFVLERDFGYPVSVIRTHTLGHADLHRYDVLILPESRRGSYGDALGKSGVARLRRWVRAGGVVIGLGSASEFLAAESTGLLPTTLENASGEAPKEEKLQNARLPGTEIADEGAYRDAISSHGERPDYAPPALLRTVVDREHWLAAGLPKTLYVIAGGRSIFRPLTRDDGTNVIRYATADQVLASGYLWAENRRQLAFKPYAMVHRDGRGLVVAFNGDPNFRAYVDGLHLLMANAVFRGAAHARPVR